LIEFPFGVFSQATRIDTRRRVDVFKKRTRADLEALGFRPTGRKERLHVESWFVEEVGLVGERGSHRVYEGDRVVEKVEYEYWLREAIIGGVQYP
jgi:hypothetical protein